MEKKTNIFKVEKTATRILPCGVKAEIRGLEGKHQAQITVQDEKKRGAGLKRMLWDCIVSLGDMHSIPEVYIDKLTSFDRKYLLWEIRRLSNEDTDTFTFDYEFPATDNRKLKQRYQVDFNDEAFPIIPAIWVREKMISDYMEREGLTEVNDEIKKEAIQGEFPILYESYDAMLEIQKRVHLTLPECGVTVFWELSSGKDEERTAKIIGNRANSHTQLEMRRPRFENTDLGNKDKPVIQPVPLNDLSNIDIEVLRKNIMETEGHVDSMIVVQSDEDTGKIAQVDLLQTPAFFFASLAL